MTLLFDEAALPAGVIQPGPAGKVAKGSAMHGESGYARLDYDAYFTEPWITRVLLDHVPLRPPVWEPACGRGDMVKAIAQACGPVIASDIADHGYGDGWIKHDFLHDAPLTTPRGLPPRTIVTNPPYGTDAAKFIRRALALVPADDGLVAMLLRHEFDCPKRHLDLFARRDFALKIVLNTRPRWDWWRPGGAAGNPRHNFAWYVWDRAWSGGGRLAYSAS
jgi:hypothetical protein